MKKLIPALLCMLCILCNCYLYNPILSPVDPNDPADPGNPTNPEDPTAPQTETSLLGYTTFDGSTLELSALPLSNGVILSGNDTRGGIASEKPREVVSVTLRINDLSSPIDLAFVDSPVSDRNFDSGTSGCMIHISDTIDAGSEPHYYSTPTASSIRSAAKSSASANGALHTRSNDGSPILVTWELSYDNGWKGRLTNTGTGTPGSTQTYSNLPEDLFDEGAYLAVMTKNSQAVEIEIIEKEANITVNKNVNEYPAYSTNYTPERFYGLQSSPNRTFYISSGDDGDDTHDGLSPESPWKTLTPLMDTVTLGAGDTVLLKRGSVFTEQMIFNHISGDEGNVIRIGAYGTGTKPVISEPAVMPSHLVQEYDYYDPLLDKSLHVREEGWKGLTLISSSNWKISDITFRGGKTGIFLKNYYHGDLYDYEPHQNIEIADCDFDDIRNQSEGYYYFSNHKDHGYRVLDGRISDPRIDTAYGKNQADRVFWHGGIFLGQYGPDRTKPGDLVPTIHENFHIHDCTFTDCDSGFGCAWYYSHSYAPYLRNLVMENCSGNGVLQGIFMLNHVDGALINNVVLESGGGYSSTGVAGAFLERCKNIMITDSRFSGVKRSRSALDTPCHDGVGLDFEGVCENILVKDTEFSHNDGSGVLICNTAPDTGADGWTDHPNRDIHFENVSFIDNGNNPDMNDWPERDTAYDIKNWQPNSTGYFKGISASMPHTKGLFSLGMEDNWTIYGDVDPAED